MLSPAQLLEVRLCGAAQAARLRVIAAGFGHLLDNGFHVHVFDDARLAEECPHDSGWAGRYVRHSVLRPTGVILGIVPDRHDSPRDMVDTLVHEVGHALWDTLGEGAKAQWCRAVTNHPGGPEEAFADEFMVLGNQPYLLRHPDLFRRVTTAAEKAAGLRYRVRGEPCDSIEVRTAGDGAVMRSLSLRSSVRPTPAPTPTAPPPRT